MTQDALNISNIFEQYHRTKSLLQMGVGFHRQLCTPPKLKLLFAESENGGRSREQAYWVV